MQVSTLWEARRPTVKEEHFRRSCVLHGLSLAFFCIQQVQEEGGGGVCNTITRMGVDEHAPTPPTTNEPAMIIFGWSSPMQSCGCTMVGHVILTFDQT